MTFNSHSELKCDDLFLRFLQFLQQNKLPFLASLLWGLLAHGYTFTNKLPNSDDIGNLFTKGATVGSGRWGLEILSLVFPNYSMPWLYGIVSIFLIAVAVCLIIQMFHIKSIFLQCTLAGLILSFPSLTATFTYMFTSSSYAAAFLMAVGAAYIFQPSRAIKSAPPAIILCILASSIYQAYIAITASLLVLMLIQKLLDENNTEKEIFHQGIYSVIYLAVSMAFYWISCQIAFQITGNSLNTYSQDALSFDFSSIFTNIFYAYKYFLSTFFFFNAKIIPNVFSQILHFICIALVGGYFVFWFAKNIRKPLRFALMAFLLVILPLSINCIHLFIHPQHIHTLVMYSFISIYIFAAIAVEHCLVLKPKHRLGFRIRNISLESVNVCMAMVLVCNIYTANKVYLNLALRYENFYSFCANVVSQMQAIPEYTNDTQIAIIGDYSHPEFYEEHFPDIDWMMGAAGVYPGIIFTYEMFEYYLGYDINGADYARANQLAQTSTFADMPSYPNYGYAAMIDGTVVIKLSDVS